MGHAATMADLFTPQRRQGGPSYQRKTLVGNWSEDLEAEEHLFKDYMRKKDYNNLKVTGAADKLAMSFAMVKRADCPERHIRYGDFVGLCSEGTRGVLSADPDERSGVFASTSDESKETAPTCRNTFRVLCHEGVDQEILRYGDKIKINTIPMFDQDLCLSSERVIPGFASPLTKNQMVVFSPYDTFNNVWQVLCADSMRRFETLGMPCLLGERIVLKHCMTNSMLAAMPNTYPNEFGMEHEVCCKQFKDMGKVGSISQEFEGKAGATLLQPSCVAPNVWMFQN